MQFKVGDSKRRHHGDMYTTAYLEGSARQKCETVIHMHAIEHVMANEASKEDPLTENIESDVAFFAKSKQTTEEICVQKVKENNRWHTKFAKMQVCCMQLFLLTGFWKRKTHGSRATGCF